MNDVCKYISLCSISFKANIKLGLLPKNIYIEFAAFP